eukprot:1432506-Amphidinium_carterae.1
MRTFRAATRVIAAKTLNSLGSAYGALGNASKSRDYLERVLRIKENPPQSRPCRSGQNTQ